MQESAARCSAFIVNGCQRAYKNLDRWARILVQRKPRVSSAETAEFTMDRLQATLAEFERLGRLAGLLTQQEQDALAMLNAVILRRYITGQYSTVELTAFLNEHDKEQNRGNG